MTRSSRQPTSPSPLSGRRIVVTRPQQQARSFVQALAELGAEVVAFPAVEIRPLGDSTALDEAIRRIGDYDWIIFTSANGVRHFLARSQALGQDLGGVRVGAIGPETARVLERHGVEVELVPRAYRAEGILEGLASERVAGVRFLLARVAGARDVLPRILRQRGATVDVVETYLSRAVTDGGERLAGLLKGGVDCVTFTSSSTVNAFVDMLSGENIAQILSDVTVACIGPITAETARQRGLFVRVEAREYTVDGLIRALVEYYAMR